MKTSASTIEILQDLQWLQRFAATMARDEDEADDLVQDALVDAWRSPPRDAEQPLRPWLATVLRNRFFMRRRGRIRRQRREQSAGAVSPERSTPEREHQRLEVLEILLSELRSLPEDDQSIIVRRFFEDQSAADIGRALGVPSATIRSRIHRSLQRLRRSLDRRVGSRDAWCAAVLAVPREGAASPLSSAGRDSTMSITAKAILLISTGTLGIAGWFALGPDGGPTEVASAEVASADEASPSRAGAAPIADDAASEAEEPSEVSSEAGARQRWERRRRDIRRVLPPAPDGEVPTEEDDDRARRRATFLAFREMVQACMDDLGSGSTGALTLSMHEIGAPGVGTIYDSIEVVHSNYDEPEVIECLTQSMISYVGEPPAKAYERNISRTMPMGTPTEPTEKETQVIGYIVGAHMSEVRFCESKAEGSVEGSVTMTMTIGESGVVGASEPQSSELPDPVVECITGATKRWKFPESMGGKTFDYDFVLPVPGKPAGAARPER